MIIKTVVFIFRKEKNTPFCVVCIFIWAVIAARENIWRGAQYMYTHGDDRGRDHPRAKKRWLWNKTKVMVVSLILFPFVKIQKYIRSFYLSFPIMKRKMKKEKKKDRSFMRSFLPFYYTHSPGTFTPKRRRTYAKKKMSVSKSDSQNIFGFFANLNFY